MKIWKNIKWILNNPPTSLKEGNTLPCDYCGSTKGGWHVEGVYCICEKCRKKVFDRVLKKQKARKKEK